MKITNVVVAAATLLSTMPINIVAISNSNTDNNINNEDFEYWYDRINRETPEKQEKTFFEIIRLKNRRIFDFVLDNFGKDRVTVFNLDMESRLLAYAGLVDMGYIESEARLVTGLSVVDSRKN